MTTENILQAKCGFFVLNADAAEREDENLFDVLDEREETAAYIPLLGDDAGNFSPEVCKILAEEMVYCRNMLILDPDWIAMSEKMPSDKLVPRTRRFRRRFS